MIIINFLLLSSFFSLPKRVTLAQRSPFLRSLRCRLSLSAEALLLVRAPLRRASHVFPREREERRSLRRRDRRGTSLSLRLFLRRRSADLPLPFLLHCSEKGAIAGKRRAALLPLFFLFLLICRFRCLFLCLPSSSSSSKAIERGQDRKRRREAPSRYLSTFPSPSKERSPLSKQTLAAEEGSIAKF